jgi:hypothetical protein
MINCGIVFVGGSLAGSGASPWIRRRSVLLDSVEISGIRCRLRLPDMGTHRSAATRHTHRRFPIARSRNRSRPVSRTCVCRCIVLRLFGYPHGVRSVRPGQGSGCSVDISCCCNSFRVLSFLFFNHTPTTELYTEHAPLPLHAAPPIHTHLHTHAHIHTYLHAHTCTHTHKRAPHLRANARAHAQTLAPHIHRHTHTHT